MTKANLMAGWTGRLVGPIVVAAALSSCGGEGAEGGCPSTSSCPGNPSGFWQVSNACEFSPTQPSQPLSYTEYQLMPPDPILPPLQPLPTTAGDWCSGLNYPPGDNIIEVVLWHPAEVLTSGSLWLQSANPQDLSGTYQTSLVFKAPATGTVTTNFPVACLQAGGVSPTCSQFQADLVKFFVAKPEQGVKGLQCDADGSGGCNCAYYVEVDLGDKGTWAADGQGTISLNSEPPNFTFNGTYVSEYQPGTPTTASYCKNGSLTMTGTGGTSLSGVLGLRTLTMTPGTAPASGN
jgi:hypothetical protein